MYIVHILSHSETNSGATDCWCWEGGGAAGLGGMTLNRKEQ